MAVVHGTAFGQGPNFRVSYATSIEQLEKGVQEDPEVHRRAEVGAVAAIHSPSVDGRPSTPHFGTAADAIADRVYSATPTPGRVNSPRVASSSSSTRWHGSTCVTLALGSQALADRGEELAILELDAVHADVDLAHVDLLVLDGEEIVVAGDVGRRVADIAEEGAERPFVVEQEQRPKCRSRHSRLSVGCSLSLALMLAEGRMDRPLQRVGLHDRRAAR